MFYVTDFICQIDVSSLLYNWYAFADGTLNSKTNKGTFLGGKEGSERKRMLMVLGWCCWFACVGNGNSVVTSFLTRQGGVVDIEGWQSYTMLG
ncbi:uncharacterized protein [Nicotiana tomentosiformis]|uniref:uncharacterized protein isoform X2 n=1 Tax=Nicotiana tomentosiformis TaxID=4098 RepID=UPI00388CB026